jgi:hypothetical protein
MDLEEIKGSMKNVYSRLEGGGKHRLEFYESGGCGSLARGQPVSETGKEEPRSRPIIVLKTIYYHRHHIPDSIMNTI